MRQMTVTPSLASFLFCCAASLAIASFAHADPLDDATMATIISPIDTSSLKGRMASAEKAAEERTANEISAEASLQVRTPSAKSAPTRRVNTPPKSTAKPSPVGKRVGPTSTASKPLDSRGDEFSYRRRGLLQAKADGDNRYGGSTFTLAPDTLVLDYADALAGFMSFDNLGTLRERKIYRANGSAEVNTYDQRSGNIIKKSTEKVNANEALSAGGISVMPDINFGALMSRTPTSASASTQAQVPTPRAAPALTSKPKLAPKPEPKTRSEPEADDDLDDALDEDL